MNFNVKIRLCNTDTPLPQKKNLWGARSFYISVWLVVVTWVCMCIYMCVCVYMQLKGRKKCIYSAGINGVIIVPALGKGV